MKNYEYGIFQFALSLAIHIVKFPNLGSHNLWDIKNVIPDYWMKIRDEIKNLERIRKELLISLDEHLKNLDYWDFLNGKPNYIQELINFPTFFQNPRQVTRPLSREFITITNYGLNEVIERINQELEFYTGFKNASRKRGRPIKSRLVITALWSQIIQKERRVQWKEVKALMNWFHNKLRETEYGSEIRKMPTEEDIGRFKKKHQAEITSERNHIFRQYDNPNNPIGLQINFAKDSPKFWGLGSTERCKALPTICFPDGTAFP